MTESDLLERLRTRYSPPEWAFLPQVRNTTGFSRSIRTADGLAMSLWPSRGLHLHGFEIKVNRGDWLKELKQPEKAEEIARFCHFWWVVAPKGIILDDELPPLWGHLIPAGKALKARVTATLKDTEPFSPGFLASVLRSAQNIITPEAKLKSMREESYKEGYEAGVTAGSKRTDQATKWLRSDYEDLLASVENFEKVSGLHIDKYNGARMAEAVKAVMNGTAGTLRAAISNTRANMHGKTTRTIRRRSQQSVAIVE